MKVYIIGGGFQTGSIFLGEKVINMKDADVVLLTGGEDINPEIYGEKQGSRTHFNNRRDEYEIDQYNRAIKLGIPIFGICRGAQLLCAMAGGRLVQDLSHPSHHDIKFWDGSKVNTTSCHHQLQYPWSIPGGKDKYRILAYAEELSNNHLDGCDSKIMMPTDENNIIIEPELVYYKESKALGIQGHPEWMGYNTKLVTILKKLTQLLVEDKLEITLALNIPISRILSPDFKIEEEEFKKYIDMTSTKSKKLVEAD